MLGFVKQPSHGYTLIELIISIVVFAVAATLLTTVLFPSNINSTNPILQIRAAELGQAYLEEILAKRYDENSTVGSQQRCNEAGGSSCSVVLGNDGEARANFNDVDDYNGINEAATNALGVQRTDYASYNVSISVSYAGADLGLAASDAKRIDLVITAPNGSTYSFAAYKTNI
ncbi:MAG: prepilin-type N-terminal cleavage/methylation domain-containing protein [Kangiellaceae bacterium]|jgi:MSHA pilin protein MshD|nr:prepilin-type N-terminal cleavage/methylation domain-containing protein [Kangiellaceae bacterium]